MSENGAGFINRFEAWTGMDVDGDGKTAETGAVKKMARRAAGAAMQTKIGNPCHSFNAWAQLPSIVLHLFPEVSTIPHALSDLSGWYLEGRFSRLLG